MICDECAIWVWVWYTMKEWDEIDVHISVKKVHVAQFQYSFILFAQRTILIRSYHSLSNRTKIIKWSSKKQRCVLKYSRLTTWCRFNNSKRTKQLHISTIRWREEVDSKAYSCGFTPLIVLWQRHCRNITLDIVNLCK